MYQSIANSIDRRRRKLEQQVGRSKCRKAQTRRRSRLRAGSLVAGFGRVMLKRAAHGANINGNRTALEFLKVDSSNEGI
jgi:hypothetical protein